MLYDIDKKAALNNEAVANEIFKVNGKSNTLSVSVADTLAQTYNNHYKRGLTKEKVSLAMPDHDVSRVLGDIADVIASRRGADPASSYVAKLFSRAPDGILKKVGEEAAECIMAAKDASPKDIIYETADLWFHTMVMLAHFNLRPEQVIAELERREGMSGIAEKLSRSK